MNIILDSLEFLWKLLTSEGIGWGWIILFIVPLIYLRWKRMQLDDQYLKDRKKYTKYYHDQFNK